MLHTVSHRLVLVVLLLHASVVVNELGNLPVLSSGKTRHYV